MLIYLKTPYLIFHRNQKRSSLCLKKNDPFLEIKQENLIKTVPALSLACLKLIVEFSFLYLIMGDHFVLLVDRLITESTLEAAIESRNRSFQATAPVVDDTKVFNSSPKLNLSSLGGIVECRICQDEDVDSNMETPCACCGSLKYAHRRCVQRWCNEKGNTTCEICHQQFRPGYTAPPPLFHIGRIPMNFRGNWEISRRELNNSGFIAVVSTDHSLLDSRYDEYLASTTRSLTGYRMVAILFMLLLVLRHILPVLLRGSDDFSFPLFISILLRTIGIILPMYVIFKTVTALLRCRQHQETPNSLFAESEEENEVAIMQTQPHIVNIH
ncbi:hypothetical protein ERO13_A01G153800v2 [Gossypium hirsutum]|uniref:Uncharacterized protein isoform X2 n=1 Tax=Gossypium hirsutum TaxID=3635 RepID=A0A1U8KFS2_GOSHI|nr:uncharacterized protein LOC107916558 isoform X2 [Gossypium hirsutum]KAG4215049.1 hypothetical protein ERO13_A01G153800v2 [Gossypium hirsutum]